MKIDNRNQKDIMDEIKALSYSYTPEWKFDDGQPDAASVIGIIFSNQIAENINKLNQVMDKYHVEFANMYGLSLKPAIPAKTICTLQISDGIQGGVSLAKGTQVIGTADSGDEVLFTFTHDIHAVNTVLTDIIEASVTEKRVTACNPDANGFPMFSFRGKELHRQAVLLCFKSFPDIRKQAVRFRFHGNLPDSRMAELLADRAYFSLSYVVHHVENIDDIGAFDGKTRPFDFVINRDGIVEIGNKDPIPTVEINGEEVTALILEAKKNADKNIVFDSIALLGGRCELCPDFIWNGRNEVMGKEILPFTEQPALYNEFFLGQGFLLEQAGAVVTLHFQLNFGRYTQESTAIKEQDLRIIKRRLRENAVHLRYECHVQEVSFEYFNGKGWRQLDTGMDLSALFSKEGNAGEYHVTFVVPDDWESVVQGGYEGKCIRMQVVRADNCYMQGVSYIYPVLSEVRLCMEEQEQGIMPRTVIALQSAKPFAAIGVNKNNRTLISAFTQFPYAGDYVYWGFNRSFGKGPVSLFVELEKPADCGGLKLSYAYSAHSVKNGFKPLKVIDGTNSFQNSGILTFVPPSDMAECEVEGVRRYWIRIEDTDKRFAGDRDNVPVVRKIHMNAVAVENIVIKEEQDYYLESVTSDMKLPLYSDNIVSAQVWVNEKEQLSWEEMDRLMKDAFVETRAEYNSLGEIEDFYVLWHEADSFENAAPMERCYCIDRGRNELLFGDGIHVKIPQNTGSIALKTRVVCCDGEKGNVRANCIDRFQGSVIAVEEITNPIDAYGAANREDIQDALKRGNSMLSSRRRMVTERDYIREILTFSDAIDQAVCVTGPEGIGIVILMKDFKLGDYSFRSIRETLKMHLISCCEMTCGKSDIQILLPVFVKISLDIWLNVPDISKSMELKQQWLDRITDFLEPVKTGNRAGWKIGMLPRLRQIRLMLSTLEGTADIAYMNVLAEYTDNHHACKMSLDKVEVNPFMVCCNGTHMISIMGA